MSIELGTYIDRGVYVSREWKVLKNGSLYTDRFDSEDQAYEYTSQLIEDGDYGDYVVEEMTQDEINEYYK